MLTLALPSRLMERSGTGLLIARADRSEPRQPVEPGFSRAGVPLPSG